MQEFSHEQPSILWGIAFVIGMCLLAYIGIKGCLKTHRLVRQGTMESKDRSNAFFYLFLAVSSLLILVATMTVPFARTSIIRIQYDQTSLVLYPEFRDPILLQWSEISSVSLDHSKGRRDVQYESLRIQLNDGKVYTGLGATHIDEQKALREVLENLEQLRKSAACE